RGRVGGLGSYAAAALGQNRGRGKRKWFVQRRQRVRDVMLPECPQYRPESVVAQRFTHIVEGEKDGGEQIASRMQAEFIGDAPAGADVCRVASCGPFVSHILQRPFIPNLSVLFRCIKKR